MDATIQEGRAWLENVDSSDDDDDDRNKQQQQQQQHPTPNKNKKKKKAADTTKEQITELRRASRDNDVKAASKVLDENPAICDAMGMKDDDFGKRESPALVIAAGKGNTEVVKLLLSRGAQVNKQRSNDGGTALYISSQNNHFETAKALIEAGADVNLKRTLNAASPLWIACNHGNAQVVELLLKCGADPNASKGQSDCVLHEACRSGVLRSVELLIQAGVNLNVREPVIAACGKGHLEILNLLITSGADVNRERPEDGGDALYIAAQQGFPKLVERLLEAGANANHIRNKNQGTALYVACHHGFEEIAKLLLTKGKADPNLGQALPLVSCCKQALESALPIATALLEAGADVNKPDSAGNFALLVSADKGCVELMRLLVSHGAKLDQLRETDGGSALYIAAQNGHLEAVKFLIESGASLDLIRHSNGRTPLSVACSKGQHEIARELLKHKARMCFEGQETPLVSAVLGNHLKVVRVLLAFDVDVNQERHKNGHTPLALALRGRSLEIAKLLLDQPTINVAKAVGAVHWAVYHHYDDMLLRLLEMGADVDAVVNLDGSENAPNKGVTALRLALHRGNARAMKILLDFGADAASCVLEPTIHPAITFASQAMTETETMFFL